MRSLIRDPKREDMAFRPLLEPCERRELLSGIIASSASMVRVKTGLRVQDVGSAFALPTAGSNTFVSPPGTPTAETLAKTRFRATFVGPYHVGPGRTSAESSQLYIRGSGRSNFFLHGTTQLRAVTPVDTASAPVGTIVLVDRNINNSGQLGLDLTADPASIDGQGRIRRFTWTVDSNYSSGVFTNAAGQGTLDIKYGRVPGPGKFGMAAMLIQGRVLTQGIGDPTLNAPLDS